MRNHEGSVRGFYRSSKAWYANDTNNIDIMVGMYHEEGGTSGEFEIIWEKLNDKLIPRLKACSASWSALSNFKDLIDEMVKIDDEYISEEEFYELLLKLGIKDLTKYTLEAGKDN